MIATADRIVESLATTGWHAGESIFAGRLTRLLATRANTLARAGALNSTRIGRGDGQQVNSSIRSDQTLWLTDAPVDATEQEALAAVHMLRNRLNESLFLGARDAELHFAHYAPGAFYRTHRDRFRDDDARVVSLVFYLNEDWPDGAGGELVLYAADDSGQIVTRVAPRAGTMLCFLSDQFPHEVLPANRDRYSLTGWLRRSSP